MNWPVNAAADLVESEISARHLDVIEIWNKITQTAENSLSYLRVETIKTEHGVKKLLRK